MFINAFETNSLLKTLKNVTFATKFYLGRSYSCSMKVILISWSQILLCPQAWSFKLRRDWFIRREIYIFILCYLARPKIQEEPTKWASGLKTLVQRLEIEPLLQDAAKQSELSKPPCHEMRFTYIHIYFIRPKRAFQNKEILKLC